MFSGLQGCKVIKQVNVSNGNLGPKHLDVAVREKSHGH